MGVRRRLAREWIEGYVRLRRELWVARSVSRALERARPVVALESALVTHGSAPPPNLEIARKMTDSVREEGAVPAVVGVLNGSARVGMPAEDVEKLASDRCARKISLRDLPIALADGASRGTTVAAIAHVVVVASARAKAILGLPRTQEYLGTRGVPVIGWGTDEFPAFYSRRSGLGVDAVAEPPEEVSEIARMRADLGLCAALLVRVPIPRSDELPAEEAEAAIAWALQEAEMKGIRGKELTPFLLDQMVARAGGRAQRANEALLVNNARVAARISRAMVANQ